jgi:dipeptidyl aminopeptidase/acylaminoacyl peptidase
MQAEFGQPLWQLGAATYAFDGPSRIVATYCVAGSWRLATIDTATNVLTDIDTPYTLIADPQARDGRAVFIAASPNSPSGLVSLDLATGATEILKRTTTIDLDPATISTPQTIEFPTTNNLTAFAFYYPPRNADYEPPSMPPVSTGGMANTPIPRPEGRGMALPPLLVMSHGGPTAATAPVLSTRIQYWTSRGIAVLDVNYGGSTGYGRDYRQRLNRRWGIVDVDDCVNGALYLVARGLVDPNRLAITGGSAGGYTTLCALTFHDTFKAGASHYGIGDLAALATDTHKFESRYLDNLVGPFSDPSRDTVRPEPRRDVEGPEPSTTPLNSGAPMPRPSGRGMAEPPLASGLLPLASPPLAGRALYEARSPIHHLEGLSCPVIFFQGLEDRIVPPNQAEAMVAALRARGVPVAYLPFEGEQHGFRRAENIKRSLEAELYFYGRIFGFPPADAIAPVDIANL